MKARREFLVLGWASLCALAVPLASVAQQKMKVWRIGFFYGGSRQSALDTGRYAMFLQGMRDLGYVEGKQFVIEARYADGKAERLPDLAADLVKSKVDVIVATGTPVHHALRRATRTIPIVITTSTDPVGDGLVASLVRPGGNVTGLTSDNIDVISKHFELLMTAVPRLSRVAVLSNPAHSGHPPRLKIVQAIAQRNGMHVVPMDGGTPDDITRAFGAMAKDRAGAVMILADTFFLQQTRQIAELALKHRLPSIYVARDYAEAGGLMSYGPNLSDNFRRAAIYVDKILKGAKPGELPIEQPMTFNLVINRKTAKALGITIPQSVLVLADGVIE